MFQNGQQKYFIKEMYLIHEKNLKLNFIKNVFIILGAYGSKRDTVQHEFIKLLSIAYIFVLTVFQMLRAMR